MQRALAGLVLFGALLGAGSVQAQSAGTLIAGPFTVTLPSSSLFSFAAPFNVPPPVAHSYLLRVELGTPNSLTTLSVKLNNVQVLALSDFAGGVTRVDRVATLLLSDTIALQLAGATGTKITVTVFNVVMPKPVGLSPNPLALNAGTSGTLTATLSPTPTATGTLNVTSSNPQAATVPASVSFSSGQSSVAISVSARGAGSATITASANGGQASATVTVKAEAKVYYIHHEQLPKILRLCTCYWLCVSCDYPAIWSGNKRDLPSTGGRLFYDSTGGALKTGNRCLCDGRPGPETPCKPC